MLTFYLCFLAGGVVLPLLNLIMGFLSGGFDPEVDTDLDIDTDFDIDTKFDIDTEFEIDTEPGADAGTNPGAGTESDADPGGEGVLSISLIPTSLLALSALAIAFGATGALMTLGNRSWLLTLVLSVIFGYLASMVIQTLIKTLKKIQTRSSGINENELLLYDGKVVDTILPGQLGTVSFMTLKNVLVSYPAKCEDASLRLEAGRVVRAKVFENGIFTVEPKNRYES